MSSDAQLPTIGYVLRALVGMVFAFQFIENVDRDNYTTAGYRKLVEGYIEDGNAPSAWKDAMQFAADHASVFSPLQAVTEAALAVGLLAGLAVPLLAVISGGLLTLLFVSELGVSWLWELPPLIVASLLVVLICAPAFTGHRRDLLLARRLTAIPGSRRPLAARIALAALVGAAVGGLAALSDSSDAAALWTAIVIGLLLAADVTLQRLLADSPPPSDPSSPARA